jgi:hypothetical protein
MLIGFILGLCIVGLFYAVSIVLFFRAMNEEHKPHQFRFYTFATACGIVAVGFLIVLLYKYKTFLPPREI